MFLISTSVLYLPWITGGLGTSVLCALRSLRSVNEFERRFEIELAWNSCSWARNVLFDCCWLSCFWSRSIACCCCCCCCCSCVLCWLSEFWIQFCKMMNHKIKKFFTWNDLRSIRRRWNFGIWRRVCFLIDHPILTILIGWWTN